MSKSVFKKTLIACVLSGAVTLPTLATAAPGELVTASTTVSYRDLDLGAEEGRQELRSRIERAAVEVCGTQHARLVGLRQAVENRDCAHEAVDRAESAVYQQQRLAISSR